MYAWEDTEGNLTPHRRYRDADDVLDQQPSFITADEEHPKEVEGLRWFPAKKGHSGFWALLDDFLIRGNEDGTIVVLPGPPLSTPDGASGETTEETMETISFA